MKKLNKNLLNKALLTLSLLLQLPAVAQTTFNGATPEPIGKVAEAPYQLKVRFPETMKKDSAFTVDCNPKMTGFESWADNNRIWTYNFSARAESGNSQLPGGSSCTISQTKDLTSINGQTWKAGSIVYQVKVRGPQVVAVLPASGFSGMLRELNPLVLIRFNGDVDKEKFFQEQNAYLHYLSGNAPAEKLMLSAVPAEQESKVLEYFIKNNYIYGLSAKTRNWVIATVQQTLIPGAKVSIKVQNVQSAFDPSQRMEGQFSQDFVVRSQFLAQIRCNQTSANQATCLPKSPISVEFNGKVKWSDVKDTYIEYVPFNAKDGKMVRSYPDLPANSDETYANRILNYAAQYVPALARLSSTLVEVVEFKLNIEPETQAKIVLPANLTDIDGRKLSNAIAQFFVRIGSLKEILQIPGPIAIFEKNVPNVFLPVRVANLHQTLMIRKSGQASDMNHWSAIQDHSQIINLVRGYSLRGNFRSTPLYQSPMTTAGVESIQTEMKLEGDKNRHTMLQLPFTDSIKNGKSGLYALEISSPSLDQEENTNEGSYVNPQYVLAQVTDLALHMKKGQQKTLVWVTRYSNGLSVAGAQVDIYNCLGQKVAAATTNASGLAEVANTVSSAPCVAEQSNYSNYLTPESFYAFATLGTEMSFTHSSWTSPNGSAAYAPGIEYSYSDLTEDAAYFHPVIGVNLVKPGQKVPVQIFAKIPLNKGFATVPQDKLPVKARITADADSDLYYEFPLTWTSETAAFVWEVPAAGSARLGSYELTLLNAKNERINTYSNLNSIEVAEFKIPLMTGALSFPEKLLVQPDSIPATAFVKYANGVGAKGLDVSLTYFFQDSSIYFEELAGFNFANGMAKAIEETTQASTEILPTEERPSLIEALKLDEKGTLIHDIALDKALDGRSIREVLKEVKAPKQLIVRAKYQDQMGEFQTLSKSKEIYNSELYVGTNLVKGDRAAALLRAVIVNADGKIATGAMDLKMEVLRIETKIIGEELFGGLIKNTIEKEFKPVRWNGNCKAEKGIATCAVTALKAGSYVFQAHSAAGLASSHTFFKVDKNGRVFGEHDYFYFGDDEDSKSLPLALNKKTYKGGEKAIVSFPTPFKTCSALVTIEKNNVISAFVQTQACEKGLVEVAVDSALAPNAFVSVYAVSGRIQGQEVSTTELDLGRPTYRIGFANMKIDWDLYEAKVSVKTNKETFEPKEMVEVSIDAQALAGELENATVTVVALEEKILELKDNKTYDILNSLMQMRGHNVSTVTALKHIETITVVESPENDKSARKGGDEGGDGSSESELKRKLFDALVHFQQGVPLVNGKALVSFKANDSLAKFKIFAVVVAGNNKFGSGSTTYLSSQETQTFANIPPVAHTGDEFPLKINLQNNSDKDQVYTAEVTVQILDEEGKVIGTKKLTQTIRIGKNTADQANLGKISIPDGAAQVKYSVRIKDQTGKVVDSMEPEAQVVLAAVPLTVQDSFLEQMKSDNYSMKLSKTATALPGQGEIAVSVAKSLVFGARMQIAERIEKDQFAKFFIESRFYAALLSGSKEQMKAAYQDLLTSTDENGFVKYYPQARIGSIWLTAGLIQVLQGETWALEVMPQALAKKLKTATSLVLTKSVRPEMYAKRADLLLRAQILMGTAAFILNDRELIENAGAVYAEINQEISRASNAFGAPMNKWSNDDLLDYWFFQVMAQPSAGLTSEAYKLLSTTRVVYSGNMAVLSGNPNFDGFSYSDEIMETAKLLSGVSILKGKADFARALAAGIVNASRKKWYVTGTLAWVGGSLKRFGVAYEAKPVTGNAMISVPETEKSAPVDWSKVSTGSITTKWAATEATVQVKNYGQGQPWVSIQASQAIPLKGSRTQGLKVDKQMKNLTRANGYQTGDLIEVTLTIHAAATMEHVGVNDPIPGGSNIVGEAYGDYSTGEKSYRGYKFYMGYLPKGQSTVKYQYQLNNPGKFKMAPTRAEGIYLPSIFGETENADLIVQ